MPSKPLANLQSIFSTRFQNNLMKSNSKFTFLLSLAATILLNGAANAQVELTVTGSTAFRTITIERSAAIFDPGYTAITNDATAGKITFTGTMTTAAPVLGNTVVRLRLSFSGSLSGMNAVNNLTPVNTAEAEGGVTANKVPDAAFSDVFPAAAVPPIPDAAFTQYNVGVVPMVYVKNNGLAEVSNITQDQAVFLMVNSGASMPQTYLGGSSSSGVYLIGRDGGSGTRATVEKCTKFVGSPVLWATNGTGSYVITNGYSSGGSVRNVVKGAADAIGYMSLGDWLPIAGQSTVLAYNGVPFNITNVYTGQYTIWGYQHLVHRVGGLSGSQQQVFNALKNAIVDPNYQETSPLYAPNFGELKKMQVERTSDGGPLSSLLF